MVWRPGSFIPPAHTAHECAGEQVAQNARSAPWRHPCLESRCCLKLSSVVQVCEDGSPLAARTHVGATERLD